jgi:hypothetical protein
MGTELVQKRIQKKEDTDTDNSRMYTNKTGGIAATGIAMVVTCKLKQAEM